MFSVPRGLRIALSFTSIFILIVLFQIPLDYNRGNTPAKHSAKKPSWVNKQQSCWIGFLTSPNRNQKFYLKNAKLLLRGTEASVWAQG